MKLFILNGPNLDKLGTREPTIYGTDTLGEVQKMCEKVGEDLGLEIDFRQTNDEGELVGWLQEARKEASGVIINPAAFTHYSLAVRDALAATELPAMEVHISNIYAREEWRAKSLISGVATAVIAGCGTYGYVLAIEAIAKILRGTQGGE